jgi:ribosome-associated translation inhibitor RaiA
MGTEAFAGLVPVPDFKSGGGRGDTVPAGSIPVRFRRRGPANDQRSGARPEETRMAETPVIMISFKDMDTDEELREIIEKRCGALAEEFPEVTRLEITLSPDGTGHVAHVRVTGTGRGTEFDTHASGIEVRLAADQALDKIQRQLRRVHDKRIFARRREAQKANPKRGG